MRPACFEREDGPGGSDGEYGGADQRPGGQGASPAAMAVVATEATISHGARWPAGMARFAGVVYAAEGLEASGEPSAEPRRAPDAAADGRGRGCAVSGTGFRSACRARSGQEAGRPATAPQPERPDLRAPAEELPTRSCHAYGGYFACLRSVVSAERDQRGHGAARPRRCRQRRARRTRARPARRSSPLGARQGTRRT